MVRNVMMILGLALGVTAFGCTNNPHQTGGGGGNGGAVGGNGGSGGG